jgi:hypothetical protein
MMIVCAWCKRTISDDGLDQYPLENISHGICPRCFEEAEKEITAIDPHRRYADIGGEG